MALGERTLIITSSRQVASGTGSNNKPYTIYEVTATRQDGSPIEDWKMRTFEDLPLNQPILFVIDKFLSRKYGESYTLTRKGGGGQRQAATPETSGTKRTDLQDQIDVLDEKQRRLFARVSDLERNSSPEKASPTRPVTLGDPDSQVQVQPDPPQPDPDGDDIPF